MKKLSRIAALFVGAAAVSVSCAAIALEFEAGTLTIDHPWARPTIGSSKNAAAYMKLSNTGDTADKLLAVKSGVAENVSVHESRMDGDVMRMVRVKGGVEIPAHGSAELKPLGLHVMLMGLHRPLKAGDTFPMTLVFAKQGEVAIEVKVQKTPASEPSGHDMHEHH